MMVKLKLVLTFRYLMNHKYIQELIKMLAQKYNLPPYVIEEVVRSQFNFTKAKIGEFTNKTILLHKFGKFHASKGKLAWIRKREADKLNTNEIKSIRESV